MDPVPPAPSPRRLLSGRLPWLVIAIAVAFALIQAFVSPATDTWFVLSTTAFAAGACWFCAARLQGPLRRAWLLIAVGMTANALADVLYEVYERGLGGAPSVSWADPLYLLTYPLLLAGVAWLVRLHTRTRVREVFIDAVAVALAAALVLWQVFVVSAGVLQSSSMLERIVFSAYPMADVLLVAAAAAVLFSTARRRVEMVLVVAFAGLLFAADAAYAASQLADPGHWLSVATNSIYYIAYAVLAAAALVQSGTPPAAPDSASQPSLSSLRVALLCVALCGAPALGIAAIGFGYRVHAPVYIAAAVGVSIIVAMRFVTLVRRLELEQRRLRDAEALLAHQARHDALTDLPNRTVLAERLDSEVVRAREEGNSLALLFVDLDGFKETNDTLGHRAGDDLLRAVADRLRGAVRSDDLVARTGGDEFVIVAPGLRTRHDGVRLASNVLAAVCRPLTLEGRRRDAAASVGIAVLDEQRTAQDLIVDADLALYAAKAAGGGCVRTFAPSMRGNVSERIDLEEAVRSALASGELAVEFVPRVGRATGRIVAAEARVRLPAHDLSSSEILAIARAAGLAEDVEGLMLNRALAAAAALGGVGAAEIGVVVPASVRGLLGPASAGVTREALARHAITPDRLTLALGAIDLVSAPAIVRRRLAGLGGLGVRRELGEFGARYESMSGLAQLPIDAVSAAAAFVAKLGREPAAEAMLRAIVTVAHAADIPVVVGGIVDGTQARIAVAGGCDVLEGSHLGAAIGVDDLRAAVGCAQRALPATLPA